MWAVQRSSHKLLGLSTAERVLIITSNFIITPILYSNYYCMPKSFTPRMTILTTSHLAFAFGLLGNIVSFLVFLAPLPTFYRIFKRKSTEGFQSIPYAVALFSAMLLLYYGFLKTDGLMIITINCIGCAIEALYLLLFMAYATREAKICTTKMLIFFNVGAYGLILVSTYRFSPPQLRVTIVGWICAVFSVGVFAAPLSIIRLVIRTKSVEYMPFPLSFLLTLCAIVWFFYGLLIKDFFVATPNVLGFVFGIAQMTLYIIYKKKGENKNRQVQPVGNQRPQADLTLTVIDLSTAGAGEIKPEMLKAAVRATAAAGGGGGGHHQIEDNTNNIVIVVMNEEDAVSKPIERIV